MQIGRTAIAAGVALAMAALLVSRSDGDGNAVTTDDDPIAALTVVPLPVETTGDRGHLHLSSSTRVAVSEGSRGEGDLLAATLRTATDLPLPVVDGGGRDGDIRLVLERDGTIAHEGYRIEVDESGVTVTGSSPAGLFYGGQTVRQLLPAEIERDEPGAPPPGGWRLPMVTVEDEPRYEWRGAMLDVARHFFGVEAITGYIDRLAAYKVNRLHLHLTDDQGWRIEIPGWPELTTVGGRTDIDGGPGGFLSAEDYRRIVDHARTRHVVVVPEIDVPGHTGAALVSSGRLDPSGQAAAPGGEVTYGQSGLDPRLAGTRAFLDDVFTEVAAMTPGRFIHLGGDEAFATEPEDYQTVIRLAAEAIRDAGKVPIGWEEIVAAELDGERLVQHWLDPLKAVQAARAGAGVIASPAAQAYLDQKYDEATDIGLAWAGPTEVDAAYDWDPEDIAVDPGAIVGVEAPLWTETVATRADLDLLAFPRVIGIAEIGWSGREARDLDDYLRRLAAQGPRLEAAGVNFHRSPLVDWAPG